MTKELLNRCGYWYFPHEVRLPEVWQPGREASIEFVWENHGVAPAHHPYRLKLRIEGPEIADFDLEAGDRRWLLAPAAEPFVERYPLTVPAGLKPGADKLSFKLHSQETRRDIRVALRRDIDEIDGFHRLGVIEASP